ncbi:MAG: M18 family aminopeptidase [Deltaproteobacteria bacterium]|nr:MAG: M18 family aminopeptidase [Deltaproteobacteria bacterium]
MTTDTYIEDLLTFLTRSSSPFHAVYTAAKMLEQAQFTRVEETADWRDLQPGKYYTTRSDSSLIAFTFSEKPAALRMAGAHTDSPCLKLKPNAEISRQGCTQLGVEVYGGALLGPWFDRDLSLAGRVCWLDTADRLHTSLVDFKRPIAVIPSLAIHLDREVNTNRSINKQTDLIPILLGNEQEGHQGFRASLKEQLHKNTSDIQELLDVDLFFYDVQGPARIGLADDLITGARLDNLVSCHALLTAMASGISENAMIVLNDHEEVGSVSTTGAQGPFLQAVLERLFPDVEHRNQLLSRSLLLSVDNAHAVHPNFADRHDSLCLPRLNKGPVIKHNANQRYATNALTSSIFRTLCHRVHVPVQEFVMRNDLACGSTIGPLTAAGIGVATVDVGIPSWAMHSIRETMGVLDCWYMHLVLREFFSGTPPLVLDTEMIG